MPDYEENEFRIIDREEVDEAADEDYILIDSPTKGTRCISVANFKGGVRNG
jgi:hypothetical protein